VSSMPEPIRAAIVGTGASVPTKVMTNADFEKILDTSDEWITQRTGIRERRVCSDAEDSYDLSLNAARDCLKHSRYQATDLEMIICCSITKYKDGTTYVWEPPLSLFVKEGLGAHRALNFDITNACAGMMTGVMIVNDFIRRGVIRCGMVISGESITSISRYAAPRVKTILSNQLASLTVGDCGAAVILERSAPGQAKLEVSNFVTLSRYSDLCIGCPSRYEKGAQMTTQARKIHQVAIADTPPIMARALKELGMTCADIDHLIPHQTSIRAIRAGGKRLAHYFGTPVKNIIANIQEYGNTASTSHFLALYRYLNERHFRPGERIMLMVLASGLTIGFVVFTMDNLVDRYGIED